MADSRVISAMGSSVKAGVVGVLCVLMVGQPVLLEGQAAKVAPIVRVQPLEGEARVLHALNRFTFGPRPGDVAAVEKMGLQRWFEQQLNPESIPDTALEAQLQRFPAMRMPQQELMERFPDPQMVKQMVQQKMPMPTDPTEQALYRDEVAIYEVQQKAQQQNKEQQNKEEQQAAVMQGGQAATGEMSGGGDAAMADSSTVGDAAAKVKKNKAAPKVNLLGPDSTNAGNLKKPAQGADKALNGNGPNTGAARHKEEFFPEVATREVLGMEPGARVQHILEMKPDEMVNFRKSLSGVELQMLSDDLSPEQKEILEALQGAPRMVGGEILQSRLYRDIYSERQLEAVMTDFWLNHFNVFIRKNQNEPYLLSAYEREVIRPRALGRFEDLLAATAMSPAMMVYLDNWQSVGPDSAAAMRGQVVKKLAPNSLPAKNASLGLNENYGRELMELHTLGVKCEVSAEHPASKLDPACGTGYTQGDVTAVAKVFTGWGIERPAMGATFAFQPQRHEPGAKTVMGRVIEPAGEGEGMQVLHLLATSPATAKFISTKLAVRFVSDTPPQTLVDRMAKTFVATGGDIKAVLRTMFKSPEFWAPSTANAKMKTPLEFVVSAVRASGATVENAQPLVQTLDKLGMPLYGMQTPNGYSWMAEPWTGTGDLVDRMNFALALSGNKLPGVRVDWTGLMSGAANPGAKESKLESSLLGREASDKTRTTILEQYEAAAAATPAGFGPGAGQRQRSGGAAQAAGASRADPLMLMAGMAAPAAMQDQQAVGMAGLLLGSPEFQRR